MPWSRSILALPLVALSLGATQGPISMAKPPPEPDIVVTARGSDSIGAPSRDAMLPFIANLTEKGPTDQIARWKDELCPMVLGTPLPQAKWIADRIGDIGTDIGLQRGSRHCEPRLVIIFTDQANTLAYQFTKRFPVTLRKDGQWRLDRFVHSRAAVRWVTVTDDCAFGCSTGSHIAQETAAGFAGMLVVVDGDKIRGFSASEMADYLALVGLANPPQSGTAPGDSILAMFRKGSNPNQPYTLADYDRAFLTGLYTAPANMSAQAQRSSIATTMRQKFKAELPAKR